MGDLRSSSLCLQTGETPFVRPRRLSMEKGSELERSLAQELLRMSLTADRFMGEEEAEREVCSNDGGANTALP